MRSNLQIKYLLGFIISFAVLSQCYAQQYDQAYLRWKAEQQAQDQKLHRTDPNYYLSRPDVHVKAPTATVSKSSYSKSKALKNQLNSSETIHINSANVEQLQLLDGAGPKKAQAILEYRQQNGAFKNITELENVKGIGPKFIEKNRKKLSL